MHALIIGGTSGLGLEIATRLADDPMMDVVTVTGRRGDPGVNRVQYRELDLMSIGLVHQIEALLAELPDVDLFVYAAGFYQEGRIDELDLADINRMETVGLTAPALLLRSLLRKQQKLSALVSVSSTSATRPREMEPLYTATKAALEQFTKSLAEDVRVGRALVVAPGGMDTPFWSGTNKDTSDWLDPVFVADAVFSALRDTSFRYKKIRIERSRTPSIEVDERY